MNPEQTHHEGSLPDDDVAAELLGFRVE